VKGFRSSPRHARRIVVTPGPEHRGCFRPSLDSGDQRTETIFNDVIMTRCVTLVLLFTVYGASISARAQLTTGPNATVLKDRETYRGIGVNYFDCFLRTLKDGEDASYQAGFATLAGKGIPFARFCCTGYWPKDMQLYQADRAEYWRRLDGVVRSAQNNGIGLVPSLFWLYSCVPDLVGEPMDQWANPNSKTEAWMREYVREVVTRYRDNPTIWAWEFGNEYSLQANLPNASEHRAEIHPALGTAAARGERDDLTFAMARETFRAFAVEVRKYDPQRLILTGDSFLRASAWHLERGRTWQHDTPEQFGEMLALVNPDPINCISVHVYGDDDQRLARALEVSRQLNKPLFAGEFGIGGEKSEQSAHFRRLLNAIVDQPIPLAALWVFDLSSQKDFNVTPTNARASQLDMVAEANKRLRGDKVGQ